MPPRTLANAGGSLASWRFPGAPTWLKPAATSQPEAPGPEPAPPGHAILCPAWSRPRPPPRGTVTNS